MQKLLYLFALLSSSFLFLLKLFFYLSSLFSFLVPLFLYLLQKLFILFYQHARSSLAAVLVLISSLQLPRQGHQLVIDIILQRIKRLQTPKAKNSNF